MVLRMGQMLRSSRVKHNARSQKKNVVSALSVADVAGVAAGRARPPPVKILAYPQEDAAVEEQAVFAVPDFPVETALADEGFYPLEAAPPRSRRVNLPGTGRSHHEGI